MTPLSAGLSAEQAGTGLIPATNSRFACDFTSHLYNERWNRQRTTVLAGGASLQRRVLLLAVERTVFRKTSAMTSSAPL
jgi:hypothetical protein